MKSIKVEYRDIHSLVPYVHNARTHSDHQLELIGRSIQEFGFVNPVLIDESGEIIAGHGRVMAANRIGMKTVPVIVLSHLSERQRRALVLADNKIAAAAGWDLEKLSHELSGLAELDFDLSLTGFDEQEIDALLKGDASILPPEKYNISITQSPAQAEQQAPPADTRPQVTNTESIKAYTKKIKAPIYQPRGEKPDAETLVNVEKMEALIDEIRQADISEAEKRFLILAAHRHAVFNYESIADFYACSPAEVQRLMEKSALVIIDFKKAIENGFIALSDEIISQYTEENDDY